MQRKCQTASPYIVQFKYFDFPFSFDLQYWAFALPALFVLALGYLAWQWSQCILFGRAGASMLLEDIKSIDSISIDSALQFGVCKETKWARRWLEWGSEVALFLAFLLVFAVLFYRLSIIWGQLTSIAYVPLIKLYSLLGLVTVSVCSACFQYTNGVVQGRSGLTSMNTTSGGRISVQLRAARRRFRWRLSPTHARIIAAVLSIASLFLACGMRGCQDTKLTGYQLLDPRQTGTWYFLVMGKTTTSWIGRSFYGSGVIIAIVMALSLLPRVAALSVFQARLSRLATIFGFVAFYELGWGDYFLIGWPVLLALLAFLIWATRKNSPLIFTRPSTWGVFTVGFVLSTAVWAVWNFYVIAREKYYGVCAFCLGQVLLLFTSIYPERRETSQNRQHDVTAT